MKDFLVFISVDERGKQRIKDPISAIKTVSSWNFKHENLKKHEHTCK